MQERCIARVVAFGDTVMAAANLEFFLPRHARILLRVGAFLLDVDEFDRLPLRVRRRLRATDTFWQTPLERRAQMANITRLMRMGR